jgi:hypothetical protein
MPAARSVFLAALTAATLLHALTYSFAISDDAFISLRYAANLASGHGLVFNPGEPPVEGFSNPLFTLALAGLLRLGTPPLLAARGIGLAALAATVLLLPVAVRTFQPRETSARRLRGSTVSAGAPIVAAGFLAASSYSAFWAMAGLETVSYAFLILLAAVLASRELQREKVRWSPLCFALVSASRPEGALLAAGVFLAQWLTKPSDTRVVRAWITGFGLPVTILLAVRLSYYDALMPNTYNVKVGFGTPAVLAGLGYLWRFTVDGGFWLLLLAGVACAILVRPTSDAPNTRLAILPPLAAVVAQAVFVISVGGDGFPGYRFVMPVYPLLCALAAIGLHATLRRVRRSPQLALAGVSILVCVGMAWSQSRGLEGHARRWWLSHDKPWTSYVFQTDLSGTWLAGHQRIAKYVREHSEPGDVLAVTDAGVIPFLSGLPTLDLVGLNDRTIASLRKGTKFTPHPRKTDPQESAFHPWALATADQFFSQSPEWLVIDGYFNSRGRLVPRVEIGRALVRHRDWGRYRAVLEAPVYDGESLGLGHDRTNVLFVREGP